MESDKSETLSKQAEEAKSLLASIVESSYDAIIGKTLDGTILSWNPGAQKIYGYTADEVLGKSVSILVPPDYTDEVPQLLQRLRKGQRIKHYETVRMRKDDKQIDISLTISPIKDSTGKIIGASTIARDITERKRAEEALRQSEGRLRLLSDLTMEGIVIHDKGIILDANEALARMFGYGNVSEVIGKSGANLMTPESQELLQQHIVTGSDEPYEAVGIKKDGIRFSIEIHGSNIKYKGKTVRTGIVRDLTERKRAEEALRESQKQNEFLAGLISASSQPVGVGYPDGRLGLVNRAFEELTGYTADELQSIDWALVLTPPEWREMEREKLAELHRTGKPIRYEKEYIRKDSTRVPIELLVHLVTDSEGKPKYYYSFLTNITERKWAEKALWESEQKFMKLFQGNAAAIALTRLHDRRITEVNERWQEVFGFSREDVVGGIVNKIKLWKHPEEQMRAIHDLEMHGAFRNRECEFFRKNGEVWTGLISSEVIQLQGEGFILTSLVDITERKLAEEALRESEQRWATTLASIGDAVISTDVEGRITFMNAEAEALTGWALAEALAKPVTEVFNIINEYTRREANNPITRVLQEGIIVGLANHTILVRKDGTEVPIDDSGAPIRDGDGKTMGVVLVFRDITERKRAEEALRQSQQTFVDLVEGAPFGIYIVDSQFRISHMNAGSQTGAFQNVHPVIGRDFAEAMRILWPEPVAAEIIANFRHTLETGELYYSPRFTNPRHDIEAIESYEWELHRMTLPSGEYGVVCYYFDSTKLREAEEALHESEQRFRVAQELSPDGFTILQPVRDEQGHVVDFTWVYENATIARINGTDPNTVVGKRLLELFPSHSGTPIFQAYQQAAQTGQSQVLEAFYSGETLVEPTWFRLAVVSMGEYIAILAQDITDAKQAEEALRKAHDELELRVQERTADLAKVNEKLEVEIAERRRAEEAAKTERQRLYDVLETMPAMICLLTPDYHVAFTNRSFRERFGESHGRHCYDYCFGRKEPCEFCESYKVLETGQPHHWEVTGPDGSVIDAYDFPFTDVDGSPMILEMDLDITERKKAEEKILEQATLLDNAQEAVGVRSLEHNLIYWNKGAQRLYGWTVEEVIGKNADRLVYIEEPPQLIEAKRIVLEKGEWAGELHQVTKDGREVIVESHWTLIYDNEGKPKSILVVNTDITEKKLFEAHLLRAQRMESIGILAGGIAHNLNNMLTPMMMSLHMLKQKFNDEQSQKLLTILENNSQRSADLIKQVLSFSRGVEGERTPLQVKYLITEIEKIAKETFPRNTEIRTDIQKDLYTISGDATQLHQVIMNLCVNARDAMPDGGILNISAENFFIDENYMQMHTEAKVGYCVAISVSDTGVGIPPKIVDRIFEPFFTTKEFGKGTGLGLSTALAIVKSHGGFINVDSKVGKGTKFRVYLPAINAEMQNAEEQKLELLVGNGELVLVAEDEDSVREVTISTLEKHGYKVLAANDGADAVALYAQNTDKIKVIIMDLMMPVMDGQTSIHAIRKINHQIKVIAVSGLAEKDKLRNVADCTNAFLPKPYTAEKLLKTIHDVLGAK